MRGSAIAASLALSFALSAAPVFAQTPAAPAPAAQPAPPPAQPPPAAPRRPRRLAAQPPAPFPAGAKIAFVNLRRSLQASADGKAAVDKVNALIQKKQTEGADKTKPLQAQPAEAAARAAAS